jgi:hypothetical protein
MRLGQQSFLLLHTDVRTFRRSIEIAPDFPSALRTWTPGTRVSPIWGLEEYDTHQSSERKFPRNSTLLFIGPVAPARLPADVAAANTKLSMDVWVTLGCFNLFIRIDDDPDGQNTTSEILAWAQRESIPYEKWTVADGTVSAKMKTSLPGNGAESLLAELFDLSNVPDDEIPAVRMTLQEYCALMASTASRSSLIMPHLFAELRVVAHRVAEVLDRYKQKKLFPLEVHSMLLSMNAALARFSSQALSGTPPIPSTMTIC